MNTTILKTGGFIQKPAILANGVTLFNTTGEEFWSLPNTVVPQAAVIRSRVDSLEVTNVTVRVFNGHLYNWNGSSEMDIIKTEEIEGKNVIYYNMTVDGGTLNIDVDGVTRHYKYRYLQGSGERIDVLSNDYEVYIMGNSASNYMSPLRFSDDYYKYGDFSKNAFIEYHYGNLNTEIFKDSTKAVKVALTGAKLNSNGTIMDFASCWEQLVSIDLYRQKNIIGVASEFLNELSERGLKNRTLYVYLGGSGVVNDVFDDVKFNAIFDNSGNWTVQSVS